MKMKFENPHEIELDIESEIRSEIYVYTYGGCGCTETELEDVDRAARNVLRLIEDKLNAGAYTLTLNADES